MRTTQLIEYRTERFKISGPKTYCRKKFRPNLYSRLQHSRARSHTTNDFCASKTPDNSETHTHQSIKEKRPPAKEQQAANSFHIRIRVAPSWPYNRFASLINRRLESLERTLRNSVSKNFEQVESDVFWTPKLLRVCMWWVELDTRYSVTYYVEPNRLSNL